MRHVSLHLSLALVIGFVASLAALTGRARADNPFEPPQNLDVQTYPKDKVVSFETTANKSKLFRRDDLAFGQAPTDADVTLTLDAQKRYQTIDGFGAAITGSTAYNLLKMPQEARTALLEETFSTDKGLGFSYVRVSIGCSDFSLSEFSLCEEPGLENFALSQEDLDYVVPALKEILKINPNLKIIASPWTCPKWMKVNNLKDLEPFDSWTSGQLNPKYYQVYAEYFVKYLQAMASQGITVNAITMQNEPLNRGNSASLFMTWQEQKEFVKALGPAIRKAGVDVEIIAFDHNFNYDNNKPECRDQWGYPLHIYEDAEAAQYLTGAAYHAYGGNKEEMKRVRDARPDKGLYFTEQSIGAWGYSFEGDFLWFMREIGIGTLNYDCKAVIVWNYMLDDKKGPYRPGGCSMCYGAVNLSTRDFATVERYSHYYEIAHFSKVIATGAQRIHIDQNKEQRGLHSCACVNPDGSYALVLLNDQDSPVTVCVKNGDETFTVALQGKSARSLHWQAQ